ncbi:MAG: Flp family type IVb pilin [Gemmatimonadetes bacterium]|nr:Flp family type IVb pilin [Gemmatimonadota bacterium]
MRYLLSTLWREESGQDLTEYALLMALIALVVVASLIMVGGSIRDVFNTIGGALAAGTVTT